MFIDASYQAQSANPSTNSGDSAASTSDMFMQLLVTQLKNQSPLDPVDPNQFVNQLVQFNTLNQIIGIRQLLDQYASSPTTPTTPTGHVSQAQGER
jgi:flagellar basal-body rod modification protein FlgD